MKSHKSEIIIPVGNVELEATLTVPDKANSIVIFSHGSGSSRFSPRNNFVAAVLNDQGMATLLTDLLTEKEDEVYATRFNIELLTKRLIGVTNFVFHDRELGQMNVGYFGASTGAASALMAAAELGDRIGAVVSRGGRPDLAKARLGEVKAPTLLIVGSWDIPVIELNRRAFAMLASHKELTIVAGASHLFEEKGKLEEVSRLASKWFGEHLVPKHVHSLNH
jgi:pimeloyl-ACP methyl ester carboxylesterase